MSCNAAMYDDIGDSSKSRRVAQNVIEVIDGRRPEHHL
jgi:hypothetical protein